MSSLHRHRSKCPTPRPAMSPVKPLIMAGLAVIIASNGALAGLVGGGGSVHTWTGNVSGNWHTASNWNTNQVPAADQHAIIDGGPFNVSLNADTANLRSLYITGARSLSTNGFVLLVSNSDSETTVNGASSTLFVAPGGAPHSFDTDTLDLELAGRLQMAGGWAIVRDQLTMSTSGRVFGHGNITVTSPNPAAFNGTNGGILTVSGGDLQIAVSGGGSMTMPGTINVNSAGQDLTLLGPIMLPIEDLNLGAASFNTDNDWIVGGLLTANPGNGNTSRIGGSASADVFGSVTVAANGRLLFDTPVFFASGSQVNIASGATLELADSYVSGIEHITTISSNGRLLLEGVNSVNGWDGNIISNAGIIESNNAVSPRIDGELTLGSWGGLRTIIAGSSVLRVNGPVNAPGLGAVIDGTLDVLAAADMNLGSNASIFVNGELFLRSSSTSVGSGRIQVNDGGALMVQQGATVVVEIENAGSMRAGTGDSTDSLSIFGDFSQSASGRLQFEVAGPLSVDQDFYGIAGDATLAGELAIDLVGAFEPAIGTQFTLLTASNVTGTFSSITGDPGFIVAYTPTSVVLTYGGVGMLGDINGDGVVNVVDLLAVISAWGACAGCDADIAPHPAGDGIVNVADLLLVISNWG